MGTALSVDCEGHTGSENFLGAENKLTPRTHTHTHTHTPSEVNPHVSYQAEDSEEAVT